MTALIGIDWGTTSFRAWRMGGAGEVLETVGNGPGILAAAALPGGFRQALGDSIGGWLDGARRFVLARQALDVLETNALAGQAQPAPVAVR